MLHAASRFAVSIALVAATGAAALAQPSDTPPTAPAAPAPAASTAPTNTDWNAVSHINGQLVPVGEKNSYVYDFKRTIISADPLGWVFGFYGVSASYALDDHIALRGELDYISLPGNTDTDKTTALEVDLGVPIYLRRTYQGPFIEPGVVARVASSTHPVYNYDDSTGNETTTTSTESSTAFGPQVLVGWHWTWESGLNLSIAAGVGRNVNASSQSSADAYIPNGYMRFGYAF